MRAALKEQAKVLGEAKRALATAFHVRAMKLAQGAHERSVREAEVHSLETKTQQVWKRLEEYKTRNAKVNAQVLKRITRLEGLCEELDEQAEKARKLDGGGAYSMNDIERASYGKYSTSGSRGKLLWKGSAKRGAAAFMKKKSKGRKASPKKSGDNAAADADDGIGGTGSKSSSKGGLLSLVRDMQNRIDALREYPWVAAKTDELDKRRSDGGGDRSSPISLGGNTGSSSGATRKSILLPGPIELDDKRIQAWRRNKLLPYVAWVESMSELFATAMRRVGRTLCCPVCHEIASTPLTFQQCGHTACATCILGPGLAKSARNIVVTRGTCPHKGCRMNHRVDLCHADHKVSDLTSRYRAAKTAQSMLDRMLASMRRDRLDLMRARVKSLQVMERVGTAVHQ